VADELHPPRVRAGRRSPAKKANIMNPRSGIAIPVALVVLFVGVGLSEHAFAYVDLGTGSYMLQLLVAGLFGIVFSAKSLWIRVRGLFARTDEHKSES
jgi:hypothetical protein